MERDDWQPVRQAPCPQCGAANSLGAVHCSACGALLPGPDEAAGAGEETIIDVSDGRPRVLRERLADPFGQGGFASARLGEGRVSVSRGGRRSCLLMLAIGLLLACCVCWAFWTTFESLF